MVVDSACTRIGARRRVRLAVLVTSDRLWLRDRAWLLRLVDLCLQAGDLSLESGNLIAQFVLAILRDC